MNEGEGGFRRLGPCLFLNMNNPNPKLPEEQHEKATSAEAFCNTGLSRRIKLQTEAISRIRESQEAVPRVAEPTAQILPPYFVV